MKETQSPSVSHVTGASTSSGRIFCSYISTALIPRPSLPAEFRRQELPLPSTNHVFQPNLWRMFAPNGVLLVVIGIIAKYRINNPHVSFGTFLMYLALVEGLTLGFWALILRNFRIDVDAAGIGGRNIRTIGGDNGKYNRIAWRDIEKVKTLWYPGYTYLRVYSRKSNHVIGICLILTDMTGFYDCIMQYTDMNNPLRTYLELWFKNKAL